MEEEPLSERSAFHPADDFGPEPGVLRTKPDNVAEVVFQRVKL